jgi:biotin synthase-related radical SAM superfamily protein
MPGPTEKPMMIRTTRLVCVEEDQDQAQARVVSELFATSLYVMLDAPGGCRARCSFCNQHGEVSAGQLLCNYEWPEMELDAFCELLQSNTEALRFIKRICIQTVLFSGWQQDTLHIASRIKQARPDIALSICSLPASGKHLRAFKEAGIEDVTVSIDAATPELFSQIKGKQAGGPFRWEKQHESLRAALEVFGPWKVRTHLICGMGETELQAVAFMQRLYDMQVGTGLFPFYPSKGTKMEHHRRVRRGHFRRLQLAKDLICNLGRRYEWMSFDESGRLVDFSVPDEVLRYRIYSGVPFSSLGNGCSYCARHGYAERAVHHRDYPGTEYRNYFYLSPTCMVRLAENPAPYADYFEFWRAYCEGVLKAIKED